MAIKNLILKIQCQGHGWGRSLSHNLGLTSYRPTSFWFHVNPPSYSYDRAFFLNLTFKIQGQSHSSRSQSRYNILLAHIPFFPCWSTLPFLRYSYLTLKIQGHGHGWGHSSKSQCGSNILLTHIPFIPCKSAYLFLINNIFKIWPWKYRVKWP